MNKQIGRISNYRETEKRINELETKLADEKKTLTSKRQECNHNILVLLDYRRLSTGWDNMKEVPFYKCLFCGQEFVTQGPVLLELAKNSRIEREYENLNLIIDATQYGTPQMDHEDKMVEIEQIYRATIQENKNKTAEELLKIFLNKYKQDCNLIKQTSNK